MTHMHTGKAVAWDKGLNKSRFKGNKKCGRPVQSTRITASNNNNNNNKNNNNNNNNNNNLLVRCGLSGGYTS